jgi:hypothetical protein
LQRNKHNEQQPFNSEKLGNLGNARENPNVGKPKEREILLASGKIYQQQQFNFQPREIHLQHTKLPPQYFALKNVPNPYCCMACPEISTLINVPSICCTDCSVRPCCSKKTLQNSLENRAKQCLDFCALFPLLYGLVQIHTV